MRARRGRLPDLESAAGRRCPPPAAGETLRCNLQSVHNAIASEYLLIGTTDLDVRRPVIWNIGKIASGQPGALELVQEILVASTATPGAFPPVMIDVEVDGKRYQEMRRRERPGVPLSARA
jgi:predicted acylesterase/phospholipase RssA